MITSNKELNQARYLNYARIRDEQGLKDSDVAEETGITQSVISDWKAGRATPAFGNIVKIANHLGVSVNVFEVENE